MAVAAGAGEDFHQFDRCLKKAGQLLCRLLHFQARHKARILRCDTDRTVICVAGAHAKTSNGLNCGIRNSHCIGAERQSLGKVRGFTQTTRYDERNIGLLEIIKMASGTGQGGNCRDRDIIAEYEGRRACAAAAPRRV